MDSASDSVRTHSFPGTGTDTQTINSSDYEIFQTTKPRVRVPSVSPDSFLSEYTFREKTSLAVPDETINLLFWELNRFDRDLDKFEPQAKLTYEKEMITERDYYNIIETAKDDGREQGREEGRLEAATRIALKLLASGMPQEQVCELTGLSDEQIAALE